MIGGELLVRCLLKERIKYIFGVPGAQLLPILDAIERFGREEGIDFVMTRHEQPAAHMADAWARLTGKPGVCLGTVGPGAVDLVPGVYEAYAEGIPMLVLTAQNQTWKSYPDHGSTQGCDHLGLFSSITKWNAVVSCAGRIPELVHHAFRIALSGRPGPVHLDLPADVLFREVEEQKVRYPEPERYRAMSLPSGDDGMIREAAKILVSAKRPLLHSGGGVLRSGAWNELVGVAEHLSAPVTTSIFGKGAIPEDHPLYFKPGSPGALSAQSEADVVLAVGTRFGDLDFWGKPPVWGPPEKQKVIQIDISPECIGLNREVDLAIVGDAKAVLRKLLNEIKRLTPGKEESPRMKSYRSMERRWREKFEKIAKSDAVPIHPLRMIKDARDFFPRDAISVVDGGNNQLWCNYLNHTYEPRTLLHQGDSGMLGGGLPKAIAAKLAYPEKMVYEITGDGSFMLNVQELETARRLGTNIVIIIGNDQAWGMIKAAQKKMYDRVIGVDFTEVRYDEVAKAMGCHGERVVEPGQLKPAFERAVESRLPAVIDVLIDQKANLEPPDLDTVARIWLEGVI